MNISNERLIQRQQKQIESLQDENRRLRSEVYKLRLKQVGDGAEINDIVNQADKDRRLLEAEIAKAQAAFWALAEKYNSVVARKILWISDL